LTLLPGRSSSLSWPLRPGVGRRDGSPSFLAFQARGEGGASQRSFPISNCLPFNYLFCNFCLHVSACKAYHFCIVDVYRCGGILVASVQSLCRCGGILVFCPLLLYTSLTMFCPHSRLRLPWQLILLSCLTSCLTSCTRLADVFAVFGPDGCRTSA
jgi:hypothetical protein